MNGELGYKRFSFGYTFEKNKEVISLIFINYFLVFLFSGILILLYAEEGDFALVTYRYHALFFLFLTNILFIRYKILWIPKIVLLYILPFGILILPPLSGQFDNEFYFWFPYVPIGMSLLPHFILKPVKDRGLVIVTLLVYLGLSLFIDNIMINLSSRSETIIPIIEKNRFYYNLIPAVFFVFINIALILLFNQNAKYEKILQEQRSTLLEQNTDLENTLNQLHQAQAQLIQSEKLAALGTLTAGVAHEINNPLNFISVSLQQIRNLIKDIESHSSIDKESFKEFSKTFDALLGFAEEGASRTSEIVKKLGTLKSIDNSKKSPTNLKKLIDSAYKLLFDSKIPELQYVNSLTENISIKCQKESLQKAFINIFTNANEAMNSTGRVKKCKIEVSGEMQTINKIEYITVSITNNGPAIPETELPYIFDPFFTTKQDKAANGLGLSEAYSIISQHDGSISAKNSNGHVIFKISLPIYNT